MRPSLSPLLLALLLVAVVHPLGATARATDNFLIIVADDMGVDKVGAYEAGECYMGSCPNPPATPAIDGLASEGVLFRNAWTNPSCSPTRATLLTGRFGFRTGVGAITPYYPESGVRTLGLDPAETNIASALKGAGYETAAFGKWHVGGCTDIDPITEKCLLTGDAVNPAHAVEMGFDFFSGTTANIGQNGSNYCTWPKTVSQRTGPGPSDYTSSTTTRNVYATVDTVDDALAHIPTMTEPWLAWVAFNAPHQPTHLVPNDPVDCIQLSGSGEVSMYNGMVKKMDTEIGRLLTTLETGSDRMDRTTVIFLGDNGTYGIATVPPFIGNQGKGTVFEGGVNSPFIVKGPHVAALSEGEESAALINSTDVFDTLMDVAGIAPCPMGSGCAEDSVSILPYLQDHTAASIRSTVYAERFDVNTRGYIGMTSQAMREGRFKLMRIINSGGPKLRLYDLDSDPFEQTDLLLSPLSTDASNAFAALGAEMLSLVGICIDLADLDGDCVLDTVDNCDDIPNGALAAGVPGVGNQTDEDSDGIGDACDPDNDLTPDDDADGLLDVVETKTGIYIDPSDTGSNPKKADTDGDLVSDRNEVTHGSDPNLFASVPNVFTQTAAFDFYVAVTPTADDYESHTAGAVLSNATIVFDTTTNVDVTYPAPIANVPNPAGGDLDLVVVDDLGDNPATSGTRSLGVDDSANDDKIAAGSTLAFSFDPPVRGFGLRVITAGEPGVDLFDGDIELEISGGDSVGLETRDGEFVATVGSDDYYAYFLAVTAPTPFAAATLKPGTPDPGTSFSYNVDDMLVAPEPGQLMLLAAGVLCMTGACRWRRRR